MRLIVAGSRTFNDYILLDNCIANAHDLSTLEIVSGTASGADQLGERFAKQYGLKLHRYPAEWNKYGKSAGYKRNEVMAQNADALIAFWDGISKGTEHMINLAERYNLEITVVKF